MIACTIQGIVDFHRDRRQHYAPAVSLMYLRALLKSEAEWKAEAERLSTELAALRQETR